MTDFLVYIRDRRAALARELRELETAERVYVASTGRQGTFMLDPTPQVSNASVSTSTALITNIPQTSIQDMVLVLLTNRPPEMGLTALQMLEEFRKHFGRDISRTSLSPQLSRLKSDGKITNERGVWKIKKPNAPTTGQEVEASDS